MPPPSALPDLLSNVRAHLIAQGVVRDPRTAGALPPMFIEPQDGAPAPGDREGSEDHATEILSLFRSGGVGLAFIEQRYHRKDTVDIVLRGATGAGSKLVAQREEALRWALLTVPGSPAGTPAMNWTMGSLTVIQSTLWRPLQPLDFSGDPPIYTGIVSFYFELYASG